MNFADVSGQTLDDKYKIERELGKGGMGSVYLATHLGTERPVAVKVIAPQFMERPEFVERFRREARAAGRLRHPNVVNVTDFGFANTPCGHVAYLVMEYLDGCTLGEILEEENRLPVGWSLDILEQVCSAVQEAHEQGIIHRDLKPDNIWLEPNQRGGYTVKVLDFGIAKLEEPTSERENSDADAEDLPNRLYGQPTAISGSVGTIADGGGSTIAQAQEQGTRVSEARTMMQSAADGSEAKTALFDSGDAQKEAPDPVGTRLVSARIETARNVGARETPDGARTGVTTDQLTRVGAVLGTPLYMSPEQCRGEKLDARSDIYSLGVIAYQMLSGHTPFSGDFTTVMASHQENPAPPLDAKKVRKKLKRVVASALEKDPERRPQTAEAFATSLRSRSEGIFGLLRRAAMIYTEHMPKFLLLSAFFSLPMIVFTIGLVVLSFLKASEAISPAVAGTLITIDGIALGVISAFCAYLIIGTITWIVAQSMAVPLRPIRLRAALKEAWKKWKTFAGTGLLSTVLTVLIGAVTCGVGFVVMSVLWMLVAPVVMMENIRGLEALKRSKNLVKRSLATSAAAYCIMFLIPFVSAGSISFVVKMTARAFDPTRSNIQIKQTQQDENSEASAVAPDKDGESININIGNNRAVRFSNREKDMQSRLKDTVLESLLHLFLLPIQVITTSFTAIIVALLYLKTRQAGGESMQDLLGKFESSEQPRKKWQERVRRRLIQSGRVTSRP